MAREWEPNYRERIVTWVWERGAAHWPERWSRVMGPLWDAKRERERKRRPHLWPRLARTAGIWADALGGLERDAVAHAMTVCEQRAELPNLREFLVRCHEHAGPVRRQPEPPPETDEQRAARRARGAQGLAAVRGLLGEWENGR